MNIDFEIIRKSLQKSLSPKEQYLLNLWLEESSAHRRFYDDIKAVRGNKEGIRLNAEKKSTYRNEFVGNLNKLNQQKKRSSFRWMYYAASIMLPIAIIVSLFILQDNKYDSVAVADTHVIRPGESRSILINENGEEFLLDSISKNLPAKEGTSIKVEDNNIRYSANSKISHKLVYNTLNIPRGSEWKLVLADGTKVWLNAATRLRYPVNFTAKERKVFLEGEAYFEVSHNKNKPFVVVADNANIKVYGTKFNINTREKDIVKTTLVEGSVSVSASNLTETMLKPSYMAEYSAANGKCNIKKVDVENYIAWKSGNYIFEETDLETIMEELSLWYDTEVFFQNSEAKKLKFSGYLRKYESIDKILRLIEKTSHVKLEIKGRAIYVRK